MVLDPNPLIDYEDEGTVIFRNVRNDSPNDTVSHELLVIFCVLVMSLFFVHLYVCSPYVMGIFNLTLFPGKRKVPTLRSITGKQFLPHQN